MLHIGLLGGTFDPIHHGHIRLALEALEQLRLDRVKLIPLNIPPHRNTPIASAFHRRQMLAAAIKAFPKLVMDCRELENNAVSFTINTLKSLRRETEKDTFYLILGHDALINIDTWKNWKNILDYAHIVVANRPDQNKARPSAVLKSWIDKYRTVDINRLKESSNGYICFINIPMLDISSSMIRTARSRQKNINQFLPIKTLNYIKDNKLYLDTAWTTKN